MTEEQFKKEAANILRQASEDVRAILDIDDAIRVRGTPVTDAEGAALGLIQQRMEAAQQWIRLHVSH